MVTQARYQLPICTIVATAEKHAGIRAQINGAGFVRCAGSDMPDTLEGGIWKVLELHSFFGHLPCFAGNAFDLESFFGDLPRFAVVCAGMEMGTKPGIADRSEVAPRLARVLRDMMHFLAGEKRASTVPSLAIF